MSTGVLSIAGCFVHTVCWLDKLWNAHPSSQ